MCSRRNCSRGCGACWFLVETVLQIQPRNQYKGRSLFTLKMVRLVASDITRILKTRNISEEATSRTVPLNLFDLSLSCDMYRVMLDIIDTQGRDNAEGLTQHAYVYEFEGKNHRYIDEIYTELTSQDVKFDKYLLYCIAEYFDGFTVGVSSSSERDFLFTFSWNSDVQDSPESQDS